MTRVGRRIARLYSWAVGLLGLGFLFVWLALHADGIPALLTGQYFALFAMLALLEVYRMPARAELSVGFSLTAVVSALLLGGATPAMLLNLGALAPVLFRKKSFRLTVFSSGVLVLATAAGTAAASALGRPFPSSSSSLGLDSLLIFVAAHFLSNTLLVGVHSVLNQRHGRSGDHAYNFGLHLIFVMISASLGMIAALAHNLFGAMSLYFLCATLTAIAILVSLTSRVAVNREGLFGLYQAASSINEALTLKEVFDRARGFLGTLLDPDFAWLSLPAGDSDEQLTVAYTWGKGSVDLERAASHVTLMPRERLTQPVDGQIAPGYDSDSTDNGYLGWVSAMQLRLGRQFLGEFGVASLSVRTDVSEGKLQLFAVLSSHLALAVDNALKFERATMLAFTDPLTGLFNYRHFHSLFNEAIQRSEKSGSQVSLIYVDLDYFREVNNTYGHQVGDEALKAIGKIIHSSCRDNDVVCRPGGDEFSVILPGVVKDKARVIAERIRENLIAARLNVGLPEPLANVIGASVGVSTYPEDGSDVDSLVRKADMDMYASKPEAGRTAVQSP